MQLFEHERSRQEDEKTSLFALRERTTELRIGVRIYQYRTDSGKLHKSLPYSVEAASV